MVERNWDVEKAKKMSRLSLEWTSENKLDELLTNFTVPEVIAKHFPGGICGQDKFRHPAFICPAGRIDPFELMHSASKRQLTLSRFYSLEKLEKEVLLARTRKMGKTISQIVVIFDLQHVSRRLLWRPWFNFFLEMSPTLEANYLELMAARFTYTSEGIDEGFQLVTVDRGSKEHCYIGEAESGDTVSWSSILRPMISSSVSGGDEMFCLPTSTSVTASGSLCAENGCSNNKLDIEEGDDANVSAKVQRAVDIELSEVMKAVGNPGYSSLSTIDVDVTALMMTLLRTLPIIRCRFRPSERGSQDLFFYLEVEIQATN
ncbi:hypothetical protein Aperf_G00000030187 [Anoplocephala perfoliata]